MELIQGVLEAIVTESGKIASGASIGLVLTITLFASIRGFVTSYRLTNFKGEGVLVLPILCLFAAGAIGYLIQTLTTDFQYQHTEQMTLIEVGLRSEWAVQCEANVNLGFAVTGTTVPSNDAIAMCLYQSSFLKSFQNLGLAQLITFGIGWLALIAWVLFNLWRVGRLARKAARQKAQTTAERVKTALVEMATNGPFGFLTYREFAERFKLPFPTIARKSVIQAAAVLTKADQRIQADLTYLLHSSDTGYPSVIEGGPAARPNDQQKDFVRKAAQVLIGRFAPDAINPYESAPASGAPHRRL